MVSKSGKSKILLVDDHPVVRESLAIMVNRETDMVVCAEVGDADQAVRAVEEKQPDLAIVDLSLNSGSGLDLIKTLKAKFPRLRIVVFSMHDERLYAERCIRAGARGYVMKRESTGRIIDAIREVLAGKVCVSSQISNLFLNKFVDGTVYEAGTPLSVLSDRELEVFGLLGRGLTTRKIAATLNLNFKTVQTHCANIKQKLKLTSATELIREATKWHEESVRF